MNTLPSHCKDCREDIKKHCAFRLICTDEKPFEFTDMSKERYATQGNCCHSCSAEADRRGKNRSVIENEIMIESIQNGI